MIDLEQQCLEALPHEMEALLILLEIEPEDIDMLSHVEEICDSVEPQEFK
jgi:hypothetical protein